jgi:hypothetical protein
MTMTEFGTTPNTDGANTTMLDVKRRLDEGESNMDIAQDPEMFNTIG